MAFPSPNLKTNYSNNEEKPDSAQIENLKNFSNQFDIQDFSALLISNIFYDNTTEIIKIKDQIPTINFLMETALCDIDSYLTPLIQAAYLGRTEVLLVLLGFKDCDINTKSETKGITPQAASCLSCNYEIANLLQLRGADPDLPNKKLNTPLFMVLKKLASNVDMKQKRIYCFKLAFLLLEFGAKIDAEMERASGTTLLIKLCTKNEFTDSMPIENNVLAIEFQLENGANRYLGDRKGLTALDYAKEHKNSEVIQPVQEITQRIHIHPKSEYMKKTTKLEGLKESKAACCTLWGNGE